jgi:hypothetical protein
MTNIGAIVTAWNTWRSWPRHRRPCAWVRLQEVYGPSNTEVPGYDVTNVLRPGERAFPLNYQPWINSSIPDAAVTSVTAWPLWRSDPMPSKGHG